MVTVIVNDTMDDAVQIDPPNELEEGPDTFACPICCEICPKELKVRTNATDSGCDHVICSMCMQRIIADKVRYGGIQVGCPFLDCGIVDSGTVERFVGLTQTALESYQANMVSHAFKTSGSPECIAWCATCEKPTVGPEFEKCPKVVCPYCDTEYCYFCSKKFHAGRSCSRDDFSPAETANLRRCPRCASMVWKTGGCNSMACPTCSGHFCWICGKEIAGPLHFSGTEGCPYFDEMKHQTPQKIFGMMAICIAGFILIIPACLGFAVAVFAYLAFNIVAKFWSVRFASPSLLSGWVDRTIKCSLLIFVLVFSLTVSAMIATVASVCSFFILIGLFYCYLPITTFLNLQHLDEYIARRRQRNQKNPVFSV